MMRKMMNKKLQTDSDNQQKSELTNFRKGFIVFCLLIVLIILAGYYLNQQTKSLDQQNSHVLENL